MASRAAHLDMTDCNPTFREHILGDIPSPAPEISHIHTVEEACPTLHTGSPCKYASMSNAELLNVIDNATAELRDRANKH